LRARADGASLIASIKPCGLEIWPGRKLALEYLALGGFLELAVGYLEQSCEPFEQQLFDAARWLRNAPQAVPWRAAVMRRLAGLLQKQNAPMGLRARALAALAASGSQGVEVLFHQAAASRDAVLRQLAALGLGLVKEEKAEESLRRLLSDPVPNVRRAACLALVYIGSKDALDAVADALLHGDEDLRRSAAEALSNHPEEGHPALKEGSSMDDLLVRRAVVDGLRRVGAPWAIDALRKMQVEDPQWVVKNAAAHALEALDEPDPRLPRPLPELTQTPWLIAFAGERGIGVAPGKAAVDLLLQALQEGTIEQRLAAVETAGRRAELRTIPAIQELYNSGTGDLREAAFEALQRLATAGLY
jgi:HEAT repeat protein